MNGLTFLILTSLQRGPAEGGAVLEQVSALREDGASPSLPTLYRRLRSGIDRGWIEVTGTRDDEGRGRPRQVYALTDAGAKALEAEARRHRQLASLVLDDLSVEGGGEG